MRVSEPDFKNDFFIKSFLDFCLNSPPFEENEYGSLESRKIQSLYHLEELSSSEISNVSWSDDNRPIMCCFFKKDEKEKRLKMLFSFPMVQFSSVGQHKEMAKGLYCCFLNAIEIGGYEKIYSPINRNYKKNAMMHFIDRWFKALTVKKDSKGSFIAIETNKEKLENELKNLQI